LDPIVGQRHTNQDQQNNALIASVVHLPWQTIFLFEYTP
jgi:hypothetical protein